MVRSWGRVGWIGVCLYVAVREGRSQGRGGGMGLLIWLLLIHSFIRLGVRYSYERVQCAYARVRAEEGGS